VAFLHVHGRHEVLVPAGVRIGDRRDRAGHFPRSGLRSHTVGGIPGVTETYLEERDRFVIEAVRSRGISLLVNLAGGHVRGVSECLHVNTIRAMAEWQNAEECSALTAAKPHILSAAPSYAVWREVDSMERAPSAPKFTPF
jgi:hypothetical protein